MEKYDVNVLLAGWAAKLITPINIATFTLLILGFIAFGHFSFMNLSFEPTRHSIEIEGKKTMATMRSGDGRQETPTDSTGSSATPINSSVSATGMATADDASKKVAAPVK